MIFNLHILKIVLTFVVRNFFMGIYHCAFLFDSYIPKIYRQAVSKLYPTVWRIKEFRSFRTLACLFCFTNKFIA
jgi:hypothetical protein